MRTCVIWWTALQVCLGTTGSGASPSSLQELHDRVRIRDERLKIAVQSALERAPTLAALVDRLSHSDLMVYVSGGPCDGTHTVGCIRGVLRAGATRYVWVHIVLAKGAETTVLTRSRERLVSVIAHELQHAVEIAEDRSIVDRQSLERAYGRHGAYNTNGRYETDAAIRAGYAVLAELSRVSGPSE